MARPRTRSDEEIMRATHRVLLDQGPHDFTLADIGARVGLSPATLLQRFGSKRGLLAAFARRAAQQAEAPFAAAALGQRTPRQALRAGLLAMARAVGDRRRLANSMALLLEDVRDPELRRAAAEHARRTEDRIAALLESAGPPGDPTAPSPRARARLIQAAFNGALIQWALRGRGPVDRWVASTLAPLL